MVEEIKKNQFPVTSTVASMLAALKASFVSPDNKASVGPKSKLAENPPDTPAKAAASPASGCFSSC